MLITMFINIDVTINRCLLNNFYLKYRQGKLTLRSMIYSLRGPDIFSLCKPTFTSYCLCLQNSLPENIRTEPALTGFKCLVKTASIQA